MEVIFRNVNFFYNYGMENEKRALKDINLCLESNLIHGIIGPIGSGKSTMLELMNGITKPTTGEIIIGKYNLNKHNFKFNKFRYDVGLVYQFPEKQFFCNTVGEEVAFAEKIFSPKNKNIKSRVIKVLKMVGLDESYLSRSPFSLNNGEKRLVAIASVLISNPKLLIMDEPTNNLDFGNQYLVLAQVKKLAREGMGVLMVTHNPDHAFYCADRIIAMEDGKILSMGDAGKVINEAVMKAVYHMPVKVRSVSLGEGLDATICIPVPDLSPGRPAGFYGASGLRCEPSAN